MTTMARLLEGTVKEGRHSNVPLRRMPLSEEDRDWRTKDSVGLYTTQGGQRLAIPYDHVSDPRTFNGVKLWTVKDGATVRPGVRFTPRETLWQTRLLEWANQNLHKDSSYWYNMATRGHDVHASMRGDLFADH